MKRRKFLGGLACAAAWSLSTRAQQSAPAVGYLNVGSPDTSPANLSAFLKGLGENGFIDGQNVIIEKRWAENHLDRLPMLAADLVQRKVAIIAATGGPPAAVAAKAATSTIPILFTSGADPIAAGLVGSLSRPGTNITGMSLFYAALGEKRLQLLRELILKPELIAFLVNPKFGEGQAQLRDVPAAAQRLGQQLNILNASNTNEIEAAFASFRSHKPDGLLVASDPLFANERSRIVRLAASQALPAMYFERQFVALGGLMSYGTDIREMYRQLGIYAARILNGESPGNLPVIQPSKIEFALNAKTAKTLGLKVPPALISLADEVIE